MIKLPMLALPLALSLSSVEANSFVQTEPEPKGNRMAQSQKSVSSDSNGEQPRSGEPYYIDQGSELPGIAEKAAREMLAAKAGGFTVVAGQGDRVDAMARFGNIRADTQYPIASASKWFTSAVVMRVVEENGLSLDAPISTWLPNISGESGQLTLRQLLSQTSGLAGSKGEFYDLNQDHRITLADSAQEVASRPLISKPGEVFAYGGPGFQIAGAVAEAVTGTHRSRSSSASRIE
ncbi:hypothetical protein KAM380_016570 [Aeromonas caviae]|nr:hypothetical protein KAM380_016570 [Aeromonas caviae]